MPSLSSLVAAVRAAAIPAAADLADDAIADMVRTARTVKGAVWLVRRATGPDAPSEKTTSGQWATAISCLTKLADGGDEVAAAMLAAHADFVVGPTRQ